ncbi:MAG TPA: ATP-binding protein [Bacteroidales bacterium]|nr:ATP-binding protein [Bacteroidales bacterium]
MEGLFAYFNKLLRETKLDFRRYFYSKIDWNSRLIGLLGARGVGKTTLVLQHIKENLNPKEALYVTAEDFYFAEHRLLDLADEFSKMGGKYLFIDEIHKYENWSKELKLIYDYHAELNVVFTGSSILDINKGVSDLSRRAIMYEMYGLSFREYLQLFHQIKVPIYTLEEIISHKVDIPELKHPLPLFQSYLAKGYYPFAMKDGYDFRLTQILNQTLENDIPQYAGMNVATGRKLKKLLMIVAKSTPFKPNFSKIAQIIGASRNNIADYFLYIEEAGLIMQLRDETGGIRGLGKVEKVYLENTNLIHNLAQENANIGNIRETFFLNQTRVYAEVISSKTSDFLIGDITFEIGGKNKSQKQIQNTPNSFVVKDDIEYGFLNVVPLWQFGLGY